MLILIHGLGQSADSWRKTAARLTVRSDALELAGLLPKEDRTYSALYRATAEHCGKGNVLCGLSLGAVLALHYAAEHTQDTKALILIAPQFRMPRFLLTLQGLLFFFMPERAFAGTGFDKKTFRKLTHSMKTLDFTGVLKDISCPVLILCGERDTVNRKAAKALAARLPHAELRCVPGAGHEVNLDAPEALAAQISAFLEQIGEGMPKTRGKESI